MSSKIQKIFQCVKRRSPSQSYSFNKSKVFDAINSCRTPQMGGFIQRCDDCGHTEAYFHSCRNRHCPICQGYQQAQWVEKQAANTLPLPYFHVVFTLPSVLNSLMLANPRVLYNLMFQATSQTILTLSKDKKFLGAQAGFITVLHTWGSNMQFHPHIHCIAAGGGLSTKETRFVKSKESFFLPVKVMNKVFRGKFLEQLKLLLFSKELFLPAEFDSTAKQLNLLDKLYAADWIVFCKKPFADASHVIRYLGRYTHRVAISDARILSYDPQSHVVRFKWKDYKDHNSIKIMELTDEEFVRRFLLHVLPSRFVKIRYYGFLGNKGRDKRIALCRKLLNAYAPNYLHSLRTNQPKKILNCCPDCGSCSFSLVFSSPRPSPILLPWGTVP